MQVTDRNQVGNRINHYHGRLEFLNFVIDGREMALQPRCRGPGSVNAQETAINPLFQVLADGTHIAKNLAGRFFISEVEGALPPRTGSARESGSEAGFARSRGASD